jgi:hypothetical protein
VRFPPVLLSYTFSLADFFLSLLRVHNQPHLVGTSFDIDLYVGSFHIGKANAPFAVDIASKGRCQTVVSLPVQVDLSHDNTFHLDQKQWMEFDCAQKNDSLHSAF